MRKGFTLIELMIVIAIIAIIAVLAVPDLLSKRRAANEANAMAALSTYVKEQATFERQAYNADPLNSGHTYADNFQNLYYGMVPTSNVQGNAVAQGVVRLAMLPQQMANAPAVAPRALGGAATVAVAGPNGEPAYAVAMDGPYNGYRFTEPVEYTVAPVAGVVNLADFDENYALLAIPETHGSSGDNLYWIGFNQTMFMAPAVGGAFGASIGVATPSIGSIPTIWNLAK